MATTPDAAARYLQLADDDRNAVEALARQPADRIAEWLVCFHAQQAVEKALKALVVARGIDAPDEHSIAQLIVLLEDARIDVPEFVERARPLVHCAVRARYGDIPRRPLGFTRDQFLPLVDEVIAWVRREMA